MANVLLITTEGPVPGAPGEPVPLHLPAADAPANLRSLLTGLVPGRVLLAGAAAFGERTALAHLARCGVAIRTSVPEAWRELLPAESHPVGPGPALTWVHGAGAIRERVEPGVERWIVDVAGAASTLPLPRCSTAFVTPPIANVGRASLLDVLPTAAHGLGHVLAAGDGYDLRAGEPPAHRLLFAEDWGRGMFAATRGDETVVARLRRPGLAGLLEAALSVLGVRRRFPVSDAEGLRNAARSLRLQLVGAPYKRERHLRGLLEAHIAGYARADDEVVLDRLRDLGYL